MALYTSRQLHHEDSLGLGGGNMTVQGDLTTQITSQSVLESDCREKVGQCRLGSCKEPGHSILKCHSVATAALDLGGREKSAPMDVPVSGAISRKEGGAGFVGSPGFSSLGTSPNGSLGDMLKLWADDVDDAGSEFPLVMPPARRSLSLKAKKTPPGTPSPKKMVRFADAMGLDLEKVRHFMQDQIPNTPAACGEAGVVATLTNELNRHTSGKYLTPSFPQPCLAGNFLDRIRQQKVCLDSVQTQDFNVKGLVRVLNVSFNKSCFIRYTFDNWRNVMDALAQYVANSNDNFSDRFQFSLTAPPYLDLGEMLQFAICYQANDLEYWDNNFGQNYCLTCCAGASAIPGFNAFPHSPSTNAFL